MWCRDAGDRYLGSQMSPMDSYGLKLLECPPRRGPGHHCSFIRGRRESWSLGREQCACSSIGALEKVGCKAEDGLDAH